MHFRVKGFLSLMLSLTLIGQPCMAAWAQETDTKEEVTESEDAKDEEEETKEKAETDKEETKEEGETGEGPEAPEETKEPQEEQAPEDPEETEESEEDSEEEGKDWEMPVFAGYDVKFPEADGKNGYYLKVPEILIESKAEGTSFSYELEKPDGTKEEGFSGEEGNVKLQPDTMDGIWQLRVKLFYEEEVPEEHAEEVNEALKVWEKEWTIRVDGTPARIQTQFSQTPVAWINQKVQISAEASDAMSGVAALWATCNGTQYVSEDGKTLQVTLHEASRGGAPVHVSFGVRDHAGNVREEGTDFYIDLCKPVLTVEGASHLMISRDILHIRTIFRDENLIGQGHTVIQKKNEQGEEETIEGPTWQGEGNERVDHFTVEKDGIYYMQIQGSDLAGNLTQESLQFILDTTCPEVGGFPDILGKSMRQFSFKAADGWVKDLTSTTTVYTLDGKLYQPGEIVTREGRHIFKALITDAAGNQSVRQASFIIDRTAPVICMTEKEKLEAVKTDQILKQGSSIFIRTEKAEDQIVSVLVNGTKVQICNGMLGTEIVLGEEKPYEIVVTARDVAGNTVQSIWNLRIAREETLEEEEELLPEATVFQQVVKRSNPGAAASKETTQVTAAKNEKHSMAVIWGMVLFVFLGSVGGWIFYENEKNRHKQ